MLIFILMTCVLSPLAFARTMATEAKIMEVCSASKEVCKCIAKTHAAAAKNEPKRRDQEVHVEWVIAYYKTNDPVELKKLSEQEPALSQFDEQVARDCTKTK